MADDRMYAQFVEAVIDDDGVDCVFVAVVPHAVTLKTVPETCRDPDGLASLLVDISRRHAKPMVMSVNAGRHYADFVVGPRGGRPPGLSRYPLGHHVAGLVRVLLHRQKGARRAQRLLTRSWRCSSSSTGTDGRSGQASRQECHGNPRLIHLVVHLHLFDLSGRLYLQKRSMSKDTNPGLWDTSVGGHVSAGEPVLDALAREAREELSIDASGASYLYSYLNANDFESEYAECFILRSSQLVTPDPVEIEEGRYFAVEEVQGMIGAGTLTPLFEKEWPKLHAALGERS